VLVFCEHVCVFGALSRGTRHQLCCKLSPFPSVQVYSVEQE
jgi:hypothetical protein